MFTKDLLKNKRILITGGGTGLGKEMASHFAEYGADIYICGRRDNVLQDTAEEIKEKFKVNVHTQILDIRASKDVDDYVQNIFDEGPLDGLVNNAAGNFISPTKDLSHKGFDAIANIVFHGTFYMTHSVGKRWIEQGVKGSIINITDTNLAIGVSNYSIYSAAKAGLEAITKGLARELAPDIKVNAVAPGAMLEPPDVTWSDEQKSKVIENIPLNRMGSEKDIAETVKFLAHSEYITGQIIKVDGGRSL